MGLKNKIAIVTGGSSGYGRGIAEVLKNHGSKVWIIGRFKAKLKKVADELGVNYIVGDITNPSDWDNIVKTIMKTEKEINILINNAGGALISKPLVEHTDEEVDKTINTNLTGHIYGIIRIGKKMVEQKSGIIINITSVCADYGWPNKSLYSAAKAGIEQLDKCLHNEFRKYNVHIVSLTPSWGDTNFLYANNMPDLPKDVREKVTKPKEIGDVVAQICMTPDHLVIPKIVIIPMIQEINPM